MSATSPAMISTFSVSRTFTVVEPLLTFDFNTAQTFPGSTDVIFTVSVAHASNSGADAVGVTLIDLYSGEADLLV